MNKILKIFLKVLLGLLILINLFILLSGRFYLYKGIWFTYLHGKTGPTIYDKDNFYSKKIASTSSTFNWNTSYTKINLSENDENLLKKLETSSFLIIKNDTIIFEKYFNEHKKNTVSNSFSAAKTVVALLVGCALDEGKIKSLDEPVKNYIDEFSVGNKQKITIRHLLMMASGLDWEESAVNPLSENAASYYGNNLKNLAFHQKSIIKPGIKFNYQSGNSQLLAFIVEKATNKDLSQYFYEKIWSKIGSEKPAYWSLDKKNGDEKAFCCLYATTRDFARIGKLIINRGRWGDKTLISKNFMDDFLKNTHLTTDENIPNFRYALHIWTYIGNKNYKVYYCRGILGQYIITIPEKNIIIVRTGMKRMKNIEKNDDIFKIGHPQDLFKYINIALKITN